jgi:HK97 family phage major capsid protein
MTRIEALRSAIDALAERSNTLRATLQEYATRDADPSDEERTQFAADLAEFNSAGPELERMRAELAQLEAIASAPEQAREAAPSPTFARQQPNPLDDEMAQYGPIDQVRGAARTAIERLSRADDHIREEMTRTLERADDPSGALSRHIIAASRDTYRSAFSKLISGRPWSMTPEEQRSVEHVRAASLTDAAGGYAVPTVLDPTIILTGTHNGLVPNPVRQLANVVQITGDNYNVVQSAGVTASYAAEGAEATDNAPTLALKTITPFKAHAYVPFTMEIQGDWSQMENELRRLLLVAKDDLEINKFTLGTGTLEPLGIVYDMYTNYTGQTQASATADTFAAADLYALAQKVAVRFRGRGQWMANEITYDLVRAFGVAGKHYFQESIALDRPGTILGRPAYGNPHMDGVINAGAENYMAIFGDIREAYTIVDRVGMSVELNPMGLGTGNNLPNGTRGLYAWWRNGAAIVNSSALATLNVT